MRVIIALIADLARRTEKKALRQSQWPLAIQRAYGGWSVNDKIYTQQPSTKSRSSPTSSTVNLVLTVLSAKS
jgi:hypothetical protein